MASTWTVVGQVRDQVVRGGIPVDGMDISVLLSDGSTVEVELDDGQYSDLATVKSLIQAAVDLHDSVAGLTGP